MSQLKEALIKIGQNKGKTVHVKHFDAKSGKWVVDYPHSAAIGYFSEKELFPVGGWAFSKNEIIEAVSPIFPNGDPFALIEAGNHRTQRPILIELDTGEVYPAFPQKGYYDPEKQELRYSATIQERLFIIAERYCDDKSFLYDGVVPCVSETRVVAWDLLPKSLR